MNNNFFKCLLMAVLCSNVFSAVLPDDKNIYQLSTFDQYPNVRALTKIKFKKGLTINHAKDDDVYFQDGKLFETFGDLDKTKNYCKVDTDVFKEHIDNVYNTHPFLSIDSSHMSIKKGYSTLIDKVQVFPYLEYGRIAYKMDLKNHTTSNIENALDHVTCEIPSTSSKNLTIASIKLITGDLLEFELIEL